MFQFVLVLLVLGASDALFLGDGPVPCCVTNIYSAVMMEMAGSLAPNSSRPEIRDNVIELHYNWNTKMMAIQSNVLNETTNTRDRTFILYNYAKGMSFIMLEDGRCFKQQIASDGLQSPCVPADSTFQGSFRVGSGSSAITANGWSVQQGTHRLSLSVTNDGHCIPVSMVRYGSEADGRGAKQTGIRYSVTDMGADRSTFNVQADLHPCLSHMVTILSLPATSLAAFLFTNVTPNHANSTLFTEPAACANAMTIPSGKRSAEDVSGIRHPF